MRALKVVVSGTPAERTGYGPFGGRTLCVSQPAFTHLGAVKLDVNTFIVGVVTNLAAVRVQKFVSNSCA